MSDTPKLQQDADSGLPSHDLLAVLREIGEALKDVPQIGEMEDEIDESDEDYFKLQDGWIDSNTEKWRPMTDDEVKSFYPVTWTRRKIAEILSANA